MPRSEALGLTRGELIDLLETMMRQLWDERNWDVSMKSDNPAETYQKIIENIKMSESGRSVDDLPPEQQSWLRAT